MGDGFDLVDLKCAENNGVVTSILAYFETKLFDLQNTPSPKPIAKPFFASFQNKF